MTSPIENTPEPLINTDLADLSLSLNAGSGVDFDEDDIIAAVENALKIDVNGKMVYLDIKILIIIFRFHLYHLIKIRKQKITQNV